MGAEYTIARRRGRGFYDLGKARLGSPDGVPPLDDAALKPMLGELSARERRMVQAGGEGHTAMWLIMGTPDRSVFRLLPQDRGRLADLLHRASDSIPDATTALLVADDLIAWADQDDLTLIVDGEIESVGHLGFDEEVDHYVRSGGIDRAVARIREQRR